jgi:hypothetical protein
VIGLVAPVVLAVICALVLGGSFEHWSRRRLLWWPLALLALAVQLPLYSKPFNTWAPLVALGATLGILSTALVLLVVLRNAVGSARTGLLIAALGIGLNLTVMIANGGWMPRLDAESTGLPDPPRQEASISNTAPVVATTRLLWLADTIAQPAWMPLANVVSPGDLLLSFGAAWWAFVLTRAPTPVRDNQND